MKRVMIKKKERAESSSKSRKAKIGNFSGAISSRNSKGLSPIVTTVLLIVLTLVIIAIIFLWFRGMVTEGVTKFGKNIQLVCGDVVFDATYDSGILNIVNSGNIPLYSVDLKITGDGGYETKSIKDFSSGSTWPTTGLKQGNTFSADLEGEINSPTKIEIFPVLIGTSTSGKKTFTCGGQYGQSLLM
jgi:flagellin-like protein